MLFIGAVLGSVLMCALIAVGMVANWVSGQTLGTPETIQVLSYETSYAQIGGYVSLFFDGLKVTLPFFIVAAWKNKEKTVASGLSVIFAFCLAWGLYSAINFVMIGSEHLEAAAEQSKESRDSIETKIKRKQADRAMVPVHRPLATVAQDVANLETKLEFKWAEGCKGTSTLGIKFCDGYRALLAEKSSAESADKLDAEITRLEDIRDGKVVLKEVNPLAALIAHAIGTDKTGVSSAKGIVFAVAIEIVAAFGLLFIWRARGQEKITDKLPNPWRRREVILAKVGSEVGALEPDVSIKPLAITSKVAEPETHKAAPNAKSANVTQKAKKAKEKKATALGSSPVYPTNNIIKGPFGAAHGEALKAAAFELVKSLPAGEYTFRQLVEMLDGPSKRFGLIKDGVNLRNPLLGSYFAEASGAPAKRKNGVSVYTIQAATAATAASAGAA